MGTVGTVDFFVVCFETPTVNSVDTAFVKLIITEVVAAVVI